MLNKILSISLQNRLLILLGAVALSVLGVYYALTMNIDVFPDLTAPTVTILTEAHGMESEEVEKLVTYQLETALNGSPNVRRIRSSSAAENLSGINHLESLRSTQLGDQAQSLQ